MKIRTRLFIFSSIFVAIVPWLGFHFVDKIEQSLLQGQEETQSMTASAIAMVLKGYTRLFNVDKNALYVYPVKHNIIIDGYDEDWDQLKQHFVSYAGGKFSLLLASNADYLYGYLKVKDKHIVYRNPRNASLDSSDHVRIEYIDKDNQLRRLVLLTEGQGNVSAYEVNDSWKTGRPVYAIKGVWRETKQGYDLEFRLPEKWLLPNRRFELSVVYVFSEGEPAPETIVSTHSPDDKGLNTLLFQSQEMSNVIKNLSESDSRICIIDEYRRVRAVTGGTASGALFCQHIDKLSNNLITGALTAQLHVKGANKELVSRVDMGTETLIVAAQPVFDGDKVIGAVLVSKNSQRILSLQRDTLNDVIIATLAIFVLVIVSLLIFSSWLTFRINRLKKQTTLLVDDKGRFISQIDLSDCNQNDEIGELSRSFSALLDKLNRYTRFLETVPGMLRHEILNPVNTISMALQTMQQKTNLADMATLENAIKQLQLIVSSLTEAAGIDDVLTQDEVETFDIAALLHEYVQNLQNRQGKSQLRYQGVENGVFITGNDIRIVQLLDKIKDNAIDFSLVDTEIVFQLDLSQSHYVQIHIKNEGEFIAEEHLSRLFQGMISFRLVKTNKPHLGIGLYVACQIASFHQGQLKIANRQDKQGVEVILLLPRSLSPEPDTL